MKSNNVLALAGVFLAVSMLQACSTAKVRVMPGEKANKVVARDIEKEGAEEAAIDAASDFCEDRNSSFVVLKESTKYSGDMDESTRNNVRKASKVATVLGGMNSPVGTAGRAGKMMTNDRDYVSTVIFRCKTTKVAGN